jgi:hypothetical protein
MCHCLACQQRNGSVFGVQARFSEDQVRIEGRSTEYVRLSDEEGDERRFHFCPECGGTVYYRVPAMPGMIAVPVGALADPAFPSPTVSVYEDRRHPWVALPPSIELHYD